MKNNESENTEPTPKDEDQGSLIQPEAIEDKASVDEVAAQRPGRRSWFKRCCAWLRHHKKLSIPAAVVLVLAVVAAIPFTRYAAAGIFVQQTYTVRVVDADSNKAVSSATVRLGGKQVTTDSKGQASIRTNVGEAKLEISKKYYKTASQEVLISFKKPQALEIKLKATGRTVPITVLNKISKQAVENVTVKAGGVEAKTNKKGEAIIVVPADKKELKATISKDGFNASDVTLQVTADVVPGNTFQITPGGKIYFLSNQSGKIDMVKSDLDGGNRQTVLPGTGKEDKLNTVLFASRDWKYIALLSKRDGGQYAKLFLIEAGSDKLSVVDEGDASFNLYGWSGDRLIYSVYREKLAGDWEPKRQALKSYSASAKKITTIDETAAEGPQGAYVAEQFGAVYVLDQEVAYVKNWTWGGTSYALYQTKQATLYSVKADGSQKKSVKSYPQTFIDTKPAEFGEIYIQYADSNKSKFEEYKGGKVEAINITDSEFYNESYPVYAISPSGKRTLWSDFRDGKNVFFVGDSAGENGKQIGQSEDFSVYGWFTDDYILLTKKGSELRIMPADGLKDGAEASTKVSDYYKPNYVNRGFGYGYGG